MVGRHGHPIGVSTLEGPSAGGADAEGTGGFLDVECAIGPEAADLATTDGHLVPALGAHRGAPVTTSSRDHGSAPWRVAAPEDRVAP